MEISKKRRIWTRHIRQKSTEENIPTPFEYRPDIIEEVRELSIDDEATNMWAQN